MSVNRRTLLKLLAAAALAGCNVRDNSAKALKVVVAGAGIIGASIAYHLAKAGAAVTVIDKEGPATHASRGSLEWFNTAERQDKLAAQIAEQVEWGEPARMISASEFGELEPNIQFDAEASAAYSPNDGAINPILATKKLLAAAEQLGATLRFPSELTDVVLANGRLTSVVTSTGSMQADRLVLATGAAPNLPKDIADIEIPQRSRPGVIAITESVPRRLHRIISAPGVHMHQRDDGRIVLGEQDGAPQNEAHALRLEGRPNNFPSADIAQQHAARMLAIAERYTPGIAQAKIENVYIGWRPLPIDGHPVIGASPNRPDIYIAIMHSGVTLAPIVGQLAAHELIARTTVGRLDDYRPGRLFEEIKRY